MAYVFRTMRKTEPMKINRILMKSGFIYRPKHRYYVVTTDNPKNKRNRLIVAVIGISGNKVVQMSVSPAYKWTDILSYGMRNVRTYYLANEVSMKLRPEQIYAMVSGGWYLSNYKKGVWTFLNGIPWRPRSKKKTTIGQKFSCWIPNEKGLGVPFSREKKSEPYILGERIASLWEFVNTDPQYREFKNWKPVIKQTTWNLMDVIPIGKRIPLVLPPVDLVDTYGIYSIVYPELNHEQRSTLYRSELEPFVSWLDDKNVKATKRIQKYIYDKYKVKLEEPVIQRINDYYSKYGAMGATIELEFGNRIDWRQGDFGDGASCWLFPHHSDFDYHCHFSAALNSCGHGIVVKLYKDGKGIGRVFGSVEDDHLFLFNYKSSMSLINPRKVYEHIANSLGLKYASTSLTVIPDRMSSLRHAYIETPFACISRDPVESFALKWYKKGEKDVTKYYVPTR